MRGFCFSMVRLHSRLCENSEMSLFPVPKGLKFRKNIKNIEKNHRFLVSGVKIPSVLYKNWLNFWNLRENCWSKSCHSLFAVTSSSGGKIDLAKFYPKTAFLAGNPEKKLDIPKYFMNIRIDLFSFLLSSF